jgi:large subunit ribosomal protein L13
MAKKQPKQKNIAKTHTIDADGQVLGRLATQVAVLLRGKHKVDFVPYEDRGDAVTVINAGKIKVTGKKMEQKVYWRHSGYLGSTKFKTLGKSFEESPAEVLRRVVLGMLPKNKLRPRLLKKLKVYESDIK